MVEILFGVAWWTSHIWKVGYSKSLGLGEISFREYPLASNVIYRGMGHTFSTQHSLFLFHTWSLTKPDFSTNGIIALLKSFNAGFFIFFKNLTFRFGILNLYKHTASLWNRELRTTAPWPLLDQSHLHFSTRCDLQPGASGRLPHSILWSRFWALGSNLDQHTH